MMILKFDSSNEASNGEAGEEIAVAVGELPNDLGAAMCGMPSYSRA